MPIATVVATSSAVPGAKVPITLKLKVHCGCGEQYEDIDEGIGHARTSGHTLTINGEIRTQR